MKTAVCGVGNRLRGDDAFGPLVIDELARTIQNDAVLLIDCSSAPENFTGKIEKFKPGRIIIIDAVEMKEKPGTVRIINQDKIGGLRLSTHQLPLRMFIDYLAGSIKTEIVFIGVQPKDVGFNMEVSRECRASVKTACENVKSLLG